jgi:HNH endonuclease
VIDSLEGFPKPTSCEITAYHVPEPVRFVLHHIQPKEAGGATVESNLANLCDNCHYGVHRLMYYMRLQNEGNTLTSDQQQLLDHPPRRAQLALAKQGFDACVAAGTVNDIPNEG